MWDFTVIEKHDTCLYEWLWENNLRSLADKLEMIEGWACNDLEDAFTEAVEFCSGFDFGWDEIDSEELYDFCASDEFEELVGMTVDVTERLCNMHRGDTYTELIEFIAGYDPYDPPFDDAKGKIKFYVEMLDLIQNNKGELLMQLKRMREVTDDDIEEADELDRYIEFMKGEVC